MSSSNLQKENLGGDQTKHSFLFSIGSSRHYLQRVQVKLQAPKVCVKLLLLCPTLVTPWIVGFQAPLSTGRADSLCSPGKNTGLPCPSPGDLPTQGSNALLLRLHYQTGSLPPAPLGKPTGPKYFRTKNQTANYFSSLSNNSRRKKKKKKSRMLEKGTGMENRILTCYSLFQDGTYFSKAS